MNDAPGLANFYGTVTQVAPVAAVGVEVIDNNGTRGVLRADREVIVTAGAIGSPRLLLLSGIGPAVALRRDGIAVVQDLAGVGENLQDHMDVDVVCELKGAFSYDRYKKLRCKLRARVQAVRHRPRHLQHRGGWRVLVGRPGRAHARPAVPLPARRGRREGYGDVPSGHGCTLNTNSLRPRSRGTVRLRSADPRDAPLVDVNAFAEPVDLARTVEGVRLCREIMAQKAFEPFVAREHIPGLSTRTRAEIEACARRAARSAYHPVGTCRMGRGPEAVLDPQLRVRGIDGLRVCDSSVMPRLVSSNTNAASIMVGEKASDLIRGNRIPSVMPGEVGRVPA